MKMLTDERGYKYIDDPRYERIYIMEGPVETAPTMWYGTWLGYTDKEESMQSDELHELIQMWNRVFDSVMKFDERLTELIENLEDDEDEDFSDEE
jgi:hypothetical protein